VAVTVAVGGRVTSSSALQRVKAVHVRVDIGAVPVQPVIVGSELAVVSCERAVVAVQPVAVIVQADRVRRMPRV